MLEHAPLACTHACIRPTHACSLGLLAQLHTSQRMLHSGLEAEVAHRTALEEVRSAHAAELREKVGAARSEAERRAATAADAAATAAVEAQEQGSTAADGRRVKVAGQPAVPPRQQRTPQAKRPACAWDSAHVSIRLG